MDEQADIDFDAKGMANPNRWPRWPYLPLKERNFESVVNRRLGVLVAGRGSRVYLTEAMQWSSFDQAPVIEYDSFEELAKVWAVD